MSEPDRVRASVFVIDSVGDADDARPGDNSCATVRARCTLRAAIEEANAHPGPDRILLFSSGKHVFTPARALPDIGDGTDIEAASACIDLWAGRAPTWHNVLVGADSAFDGLRIIGTGSTIRGLEVTGFARGIAVAGQGNAVQCNRLWGNRLHGIAVQGDDNIVGGPALGNVVSRNGRYGIHLTGDRTVVQGTFVGTSVNGMAADANGAHGLHADGVADLQIGGTNAGEGNLIASHAVDIEIRGASSNVVIEGSVIGLDRVAFTSLAAGSGGTNISGGIFVTGAIRTRIGGSTAAARNIIFGGHAPILNARGSDDTVIQGNYVGLSGDGQHVVGHTTGGAINDFGSRTLIEGNRIAGSRSDGSEQGVAADGTDGTIRNNWIGYYADGTFSPATAVSSAILLGGSRYLVTGNVMGNENSLLGYGSSVIVMGGRENTIAGNVMGLQPDRVSPAPTQFTGVLLLAGAADNTVVDNVIGYSGHAGIVAGGSPGFGVEPAGVGNALLRNRIFAYGDVAIDLSADPEALGDGATPNDPDDDDMGPNDLQNHPSLSSATTTRSTTTIMGALRSVASAAFRIEFFSGARHASGRPEVADYLGFTTVTTNPSGHISFSVAMPPTAEGHVVSAVASRHHIGAARFNSSELSDGVTVSRRGTGAITPTGNATPERTPTQRTPTHGPTATLRITQIPFASATPTATSTPTPILGGCSGDCDNDASVTVDEVVRGVNIALHGEGLAACVRFDRDRNRVVTVAEIVAAVRRFLEGCPI